MNSSIRVLEGAHEVYATFQKFQTCCYTH